MRRIAPGYMANRAREYERRLRRRQGVTSVAQRFLDGAEPVVRTGPFAGLTYPRGRLADIDAPISKLLGLYEHEVAWVFKRAIERKTSTFIDIGCADGYYAVGMALASPTTTTFAYDISSSARELCAETAITSAVDGRVRVGKRFTPEELASLPTERALVLCDIEGGEVELLDANVAADLASSVVVVEVHEDSHPGAADQLRLAFGGTHDALVVRQRPRSSPPVELADWSEREQGLALSEYRGPRLHWIVFEPRVPPQDTG